MKVYMVVLGLLLTAITIEVQAEVSAPCQLPYLTGIEQFERGEFRTASESFSQAIRLSPTPEAKPGEYIPYLYLSAAQFEMGYAGNARDALIQSQIFGVAPNTPTGLILLNQYAVEIMSAPLNEEKFVSTPQSNPVNNHSYALSNSEVETIRAQVLSRCSLSSKVADNKLPWYFHYEFGVRLMQAGDAKRAVDSFILGANIREEPRRGKRMYGMWYIDYLPYYHIALAHSRLGEWESARDAIQTSRNLGEFSPNDLGFDGFSNLDQLIKHNLKSNSDS
jgi:hypothetical protein